jgi:hypothetical protein
MSGQPKWWTERIAFSEVHIAASGRNRCRWVGLRTDIEVSAFAQRTVIKPIILRGLQLLKSGFLNDRNPRRRNAESSA